MSGKSISEDDAFVFGPFELSLERRTLQRAGKAVNLRSREFDLLTCLVTHAGQCVLTETLIEYVWPKTTVSEANLRVQIAGLRRALGDDRGQNRYIVSEPGKGYTFVATIGQRASAPQDADRQAPLDPTGRRNNLPIRLKPVLGREAAVERLKGDLHRYRHVSVVGAGGVGKTSLAILAASGRLEAYPDGVWFVDLASQSNPDQVAAAVATALSLPAGAAEHFDRLASILASRKLLLIIDNCEHLIDAAARLVDSLLSRTSGIHLLTTSREALRTDGEFIFRLGPLPLPPRGLPLTVEEALSYPAIRLFAERARLSENTFVLDEDAALLVARLCRRLDGNPLAIELAAAQVGLFGLASLIERLDRSFSLLTQGRRTALPRHQTLRATFDWSYDILSVEEQRLLRTLSVFRGHFTFDDAVALTGHDPDHPYALIEGLGALASKSLIDIDTTMADRTYRMLFLSRTYAFEKLTAAGEYEPIARRHAEHYLHWIRQPDISMDVAATRIDDVLAAIYWALSDTGDLGTGIQLLVLSTDMRRRFLNLAERNRHLGLALSRLDHISAFPESQLALIGEHHGLSAHLSNADQALAPLSTQALLLGQRLYETTGDIGPLIRAKCLAFGTALSEVDTEGMTAILEELDALTEGENLDAESYTVLQRMRVQGWHWAGRNRDALALIEPALRSGELTNVSQRRTREHIAPEVTFRAYRARILWLMGSPARASKAVEDALALAETQPPQAVCMVLGFCAIPIALWRGHTDAAAEYIERLRATAQNYHFAFWDWWVDGYELALHFHSSDVAPWRHHVDLNPSGDSLVGVHLGAVHEAMTETNDERLWTRAMRTWAAPEFLRARAERLIANGREHYAEAEALLREALTLSESQAAVAWRLRIASSLARLLHKVHRAEEAMPLLESAMAEISEGHQDRDYLIAAYVRDMVEPA